MKHKAMLMLLLIFMVLLSMLSSGCEKNGKIKITNRSSYPLYANVLNHEYLISTQTTKTIDVATGRSDPFTGDVGKWVLVNLKGETYQIWDNYLQRYVDSTYVWVEAGKSTNIFTLPNRAGVKLVNNSGKSIKQVVIRKMTSLTSIPELFNVDVPSGTEWYKQTEYWKADNPFFLNVQVTFDDNTTILYGNAQSIFGLDEQFLINILPPGGK